MARAAPAKERLMEFAEEAVLAKGFSATSIDELIAAAGVTKSGFFYHFPDKQALARALLERYLEREDALLDELFARAAELSDDPLHSFLIALKLLAELLDDLPNGHPGCLVATLCYQERLFDEELRRLIAQGALGWRARFRDHLDEIVAIYPPRDPVQIDDLADMVSTVIDGGIIMARALKEPRLLGKQIMLFRSYLKLLFQPTPS